MSERGEKLQDAIGMVDEEYIAEAKGEDHAGMPYPYHEAVSSNGGPAKKRPRAVLPLAIAACLVVAFVGVFGVIQLMKPEPKAESVAYTEVDDGDVTILGHSESPSAGAGVTAGEKEAADGYADSSALRAESGDGLSKMPETNIDAGEAHVLTAAEWNDNTNWPFFTNLVNAGTISFPSYGIDPRNRVKATVKNASGEPVRNTAVELRDAAGSALWTARSDRDGIAYLFFREGQEPATVFSAGSEQPLEVPVSSGDPQGSPQMQQIDEVEVTVGSGSEGVDGLQVMFILDTTGSMADELSYLQKDFASIAADVGSDGVTYSANFYRDEGDDYVTKCNGFTSSVEEVQSQLNDEYATGGGDMPEAVAQVLSEAITDNGEWSDSSSKVAFLIFDAPPHEGTDAQIEAAVKSAAARGIRLVPVVSSNSDRGTELFGRALAICTDGTYVFLTDDSGVGESHLEPIVGDYSVELLHDIVVRIIQESR